MSVLRNVSILFAILCFIQVLQNASSRRLVARDVSAVASENTESDLHTAIESGTTKLKEALSRDNVNKLINDLTTNLQELGGKLSNLTQRLQSSFDRTSALLSTTASPVSTK